MQQTSQCVGKLNVADPNYRSGVAVAQIAQPTVPPIPTLEYSDND